MFIEYKLESFDGEAHGILNAEEIMWGGCSVRDNSGLPIGYIFVNFAMHRVQLYSSDDEETLLKVFACFKRALSGDRQFSGEIPGIGYIRPVFRENYWDEHVYLPDNLVPNCT